MSNTISQYNIPNTSPERSFSASPLEVDSSNPAAEAREEYFQRKYADSLVSNDGVEATGVYADNSGNAIDPASAEAVLNAAAEVVGAYETAPEQYYRNDGTPIDTANSEAVLNAAEQQIEAARQAQIYAPRIAQMRQWGATKWGANDPN
jgi:hypothetical protein